jgi:signal peptidase II
MPIAPRLPSVTERTDPASDEVRPVPDGPEGRSPFDTGTPVSVDADTDDRDPAAVETPEPAAGDRVRRRLPMLLVVAGIILIADVVSKLLVVKHLANRAPVTVIPSVLDLQLTRNAGAAFGFAAGATVIFTVVAAAVVVFIVRAARRLGSLGWAWALGLLLGGALGNLGDRLFRGPGPLRGHVVDWIHLHHWPVFNIADSAIVIGGILAVLLSMRGTTLDGKRPAAPDPASE